MKYYKTSNLSIQNANINANIFINCLLLDYFDQSKFYFYNDTYDNIRKNIIKNKYEIKKIVNQLFYTTKYMSIVRLKDNKILKLPKLNNNNSLFNYEYFINLIQQSNKPFIFSDNSLNTQNFTTINSIIYLYFNI